jgi:hypothetical protein
VWSKLRDVAAHLLCVSVNILRVDEGFFVELHESECKRIARGVEDSRLYLPTYRAPVSVRLYQCLKAAQTTILCLHPAKRRSLPLTVMAPSSYGQTIRQGRRTNRQHRALRHHTHAAWHPQPLIFWGSIEQVHKRGIRKAGEY